MRTLTVDKTTAAFAWAKRGLKSWNEQGYYFSDVFSNYDYYKFVWILLIFIVLVKMVALGKATEKQ
jgi:hypothetical protein